jgi:plasmid stability protein
LIIIVPDSRFERRHIIAYNAIIDCTRSIPMASITIRKLDDQTKERLRVRAAHNRRSMEDEARNILRVALTHGSATPRNLAEAIRRRFEPFGGVELPLPVREPIRKPPKPGT